MTIMVWYHEYDSIKSKLTADNLYIISWNHLGCPVRNIIQLAGSFLVIIT
jgi:hypothetical protein